MPVFPRVSEMNSSLLLGPGDPPPFSIYNAKGRTPLLLLCDHASKAVPQALGDLGIPDSELSRHIGWDIGAATVSRRLADRLNCGAILCHVSRLVIDPNRRPRLPASMPVVSDGTVVPGNRDLAEADIARAVAFLAGPDAGYVTGETLHVNGGMYMA